MLINTLWDSSRLILCSVIFCLSNAAAASESNLPIVMFFHGISVTTVVSFFRLATALLESGRHRVLLFDFYGRGESDTPDPIYAFKYDGVRDKTIAMSINITTGWFSCRTSI